MSWTKHTNRYLWLIVISGILSGTITPGGQYLIGEGLSLFEVSLYRSLFIGLILLPVLLVYRQYMIKKRMVLFFTVYGLIGALLELFMFGGLALGVPVAVVVLLLYTQPIWTIIFGSLFFHERITPKKIVSVLLGVVGVAILLNSWGAQSEFSVLGIGCALLSGVFLSLWIIWGKLSTVYNQHYITTSFGWTAFATLWLVIIWLVISPWVGNDSFFKFSADFGVRVWVIILIFASLGGVVPFLLFFKGIERVAASTAGVIMLLEPLSATVIASMMFNQPITLHTVLGGALILLSNYFVIDSNNS